MKEVRPKMYGTSFSSRGFLQVRTGTGRCRSMSPVSGMPVLAQLILLSLLAGTISSLHTGPGYSFSLSTAAQEDLAFRRRLEQGEIPAASTTAKKAKELSKAPARTAYHFQPKKHWMNDPNGPMYYKGYYHLFYQYNPHAAVAGTIEWGHAVSRDLIHWRYLESALYRDKWYDVNGVWSGSATFVEDGSPVLLYTGNSNASIQTQNLAIPADKSDPLLRKWIKDPRNPIAVAPPGYNSTEFRDPTTAWKGPDGVWRMLVGANTGAGGTIGTALLFKSKDFQTWKYDQQLHSHAGTGMWECPDFYPVQLSGELGLDPSVHGPSVKHVLKISSDDKKHDYYSVGKYRTESDTYEPENPEIDTGIGLRYDYGKFYASKTFYDQRTRRRILYGWVNESDSVQDDIEKGWASIQVIPRKVWLEGKTTSDLSQWPIEEVEHLRSSKVFSKNVKLPSGSVVQLLDVQGAQLDIQLSFEIPDVSQGGTPPEVLAEEGQLMCSQTQSATRGLYGPFGILVLATDDMQEQTAIYFHFVHTRLGGWKILFCSDQSRSSVGSDLDKTTYGSYVRVYPTDKFLSLRVLVDHVVVESFAQGGRTVITSRVYPELAFGKSAHVYLFNNGTKDVTAHSVEVWNMRTVKFSELI